MKTLLTGLFLVVLGFSAGIKPVFAQNINLLPEGQTLLSLTVTERVEVTQDTLQASLRVEVEDRDAQKVQNEINSLMAEALELAQDSDELEVSTGRYSVYQTSNGSSGGRTDVRWHGSQTLILSSMNADLVLELAGELQEMGLLMSQLSWSLSQDAADEARNALLESALTRAREQAERAGQAMGKPDVDLATVDIDSPMSFQSPVMMRSLAADGMEMAKPAAESGQTEVTLTVRVQAVVK